MSVVDLSDRELITRVRAGDNELYGELVRRHQRAVWRVAAAMLGDEPATENVVQQCFIDAYERLHQFDVEQDLGRWLKAIARNLVRQDFRRAGREDRRLRLYREHMLATLADDTTAEGRERLIAEAMSRCREMLAPAASRALALRYGEGQSLETIASMLGRSVAATRQLLFRARLALRDCLEQRLARA